MTGRGMETRNAIIKSTKITNDDHGLLSAWLMLDYGGSSQGFGGHTLYLPKSFNNHAGQVNIAGHFIWRVLEVAGVTEWGQLVGKTIRVRGTNGGIEAIGHIINDDWFVPGDEFAALMGRKAADDALPRPLVVALNRATQGNGWGYGPGNMVNCAARTIERLGRRAAIGRLVEQRFGAGGPEIPAESITLTREEVASCLNG